MTCYNYYNQGNQVTVIKKKPSQLGEKKPLLTRKTSMHQFGHHSTFSILFTVFDNSDFKHEFAQH